MFEFAFNNASRTGRIQCKFVTPFAVFDTHGRALLAEKDFLAIRK